MVSSSVHFELLLAHVERALNHALEYSLEWPKISEQFKGKLISCEIEHLGWTVWVKMDSFLSLSASAHHQPDLQIRAPASALLDLIQTKRAGPKIHISGDAHLAQSIQQALSSLDIDWEGLLADHLGELAAPQITRVAHKLKTLTQQFVQHFITDSADYLVDERGLLPGQAEVEQFYQEVKALRYNTDHLEARLRKLEAR